MAYAHHYYLDEPTQWHLNVIYRSNALGWVRYGHLELINDHVKHLLQRTVALQAARLAQTRQCGIARLYKASADILVQT